MLVAQVVKMSGKYESAWFSWDYSVDLGPPGTAPQSVRDLKHALSFVEFDRCALDKSGT